MILIAFMPTRMLGHFVKEQWVALRFFFHCAVVPLVRGALFLSTVIPMDKFHIL